MRLLLILACGICLSCTESTVGRAPANAPQISIDDNQFIIINASIVDGTGREAYSGAVRVVGDQIAAVGNVSPNLGETVFDASGLVLSPGFIDTHSHLELIIEEDPQVIPAITQGITTIVVGQDGFSPFPLSEWYEKLKMSGIGPNVASYVGHNTLRSLILGNDSHRPATSPEVVRMKDLLIDELRAGALGFSSGLEYDSGIYSTATEIIPLARSTAELNGRYITHIRSEDREFWPALEEAIDVGKQTGVPVQVSHIKLSMRGLWGQAGTVINRLEDARSEGIDITADVYPYTYWKSTMTVILPERDLEDRNALEFAFEQIAPPEKIFVTLFKPDPTLEGRSIADIAASRGVDPITTYLEMLAESEAMAVAKGVIRQEIAGIVAHAMSEDDLIEFMKWEHTNICSDGEQGAHPRAYGAYPRVLARYVRDGSVLSLEEAVRKMSSLAASHVGIRDRGTIETGMRADLVLFDPSTIQDHATIDRISELSSGVEAVWVNGELVIENGTPTGKLAGQILVRLQSNLRVQDI